jgi:hypothetical protein
MRRIIALVALVALGACRARTHRDYVDEAVKVTIPAEWTMVRGTVTSPDGLPPLRYRITSKSHTTLDVLLYEVGDPMPGHDLSVLMTTRRPEVIARSPIDDWPLRRGGATFPGRVQEIEVPLGGESRVYQERLAFVDLGCRWALLIEMVPLTSIEADDPRMEQVVESIQCKGT